MSSIAGNLLSTFTLPATDQTNTSAQENSNTKRSTQKDETTSSQAKIEDEFIIDVEQPNTSSNFSIWNLFSSRNNARNDSNQFVPMQISSHSNRSSSSQPVSSTNDTNTSSSTTPSWIPSSISQFAKQTAVRLGLQEPDPQPPLPWHQQLLSAFSENNPFALSWQQRFMATGGAILLGLLSLLISFCFIPYLLLPMAMRAFALFYTCANICFIVATWFIAPPLAQCKQLFQPQRIIPFVVYAFSLALTLIVVLQWGNVVLCFLLVVVQLISLFFYLLSYIPMGYTIMWQIVSTATRFLPQ